MGLIPPSTLDAITLGEAGASETVHVFGSGLVGTLTRPARIDTRRPAVVLFNAGLVQRSGPFRVYTQLARAIANCGFVVLRFDQSGFGDSPASSGSADDQQAMGAQAALDLISQETGAQRFVLSGICAGADAAFDLSLKLNGVAGFVLLDGLAYTSTGYTMRRMLPNLVRPTKVLARLKRMFVKQSQETLSDEDFREFPPREEAARQLGQLVANDARMLMLYTAGAFNYFNHARQARECFGPVVDSDRIQIEHWPQCDHTFYLRRDRERLNTLFCTWLETQFPPTTQVGTTNADADTIRPPNIDY